MNKRLKVTMKRKKYQRLTPEKKVQIVTDYAADMKLKDIMKRHDVSKQTIYNVLQEIAEVVHPRKEDHGTS